jgi:hypothetical protein
MIMICLLKISKSVKTEFAAVGAPGGKTTFERWTNMKQRKVSEVPRGKSKIKNAHER